MAKRRACAFGILAVPAFVAILLCPAVVSFADEVQLTSGGRIQGEVISKDDKQVILQTAYGRVTFQTADVSRVAYSTALEKEIRLQLAGMSASDVPGRLKVATMASSGGLGSLADSVYTQVIAIDPDEKTARRALGYIFYEDEWILPLEKERHPGLVPYRGKWVKPDERETLRQGDSERSYFAAFGLSPAGGAALHNAISDIDVSIEPRGGYIVRRHIQTYAVKDKPYFFSEDILNWQRLGVFIAVSFIDNTRHRMNGFGALEYTVYTAEPGALGNLKVGKELFSTALSVTPDMFSRQSDFKYWDTRINCVYDKVVSDDVRAAWKDNYYMNSSGVLYILANRDVDLLTPPGAFYVEATLTLKDKVKKVGRFVQYAELR